MTDTAEAAHPEHWSADVLAADGRVVHVRPIRTDDGERLIDFHAELSPRTRYLRWFGPYPQLSPRDVHRATHVDHHDRVALVAELGGAIIAMGIYEGIPSDYESRASDPGRRAAEVAFVVADAHQGRGLGSVLLEHLAGAAAENGIELFTAEVLAENSAMVQVFRDAGYQLSRSSDGSTLHLEFAIDPTDALLSVRNSRERASEARSVRNLLMPTSIAVIGASTNPGKVGNVVLRNLLDGRFEGPVFPVNAAHRSVLGVRAYATVRDIPDNVDLAVVTVPAHAIDSVLDDCLAKGVQGLIVITSGFAESGADGVAAEQRLLHKARGNGMRLVGPSALGIANTAPAVRLNASLAHTLPRRGRIGFFCESGPLGVAILETAAARGLGLSTFVSAGNRADVSGNDLLQFWDTDPDTDVVLLYLESVGNPRKFSRVARRLARSKPIVAVRSAYGAGWRGTSSEDSVARDLFAQAGVIEVDSISELFDSAALFAYQPLPSGPGVAVVCDSPALSAMTAALVQASGLEVARRLDLAPGTPATEFRAAVEEALAAADVHAVVAVLAPPLGIEPDAAAVVQGFDTDKPLLTIMRAAEGLPPGSTVDGADGNPGRGSVPNFTDPQTAVRALVRAWRYAQWRARPASAITDLVGLQAQRARELVVRRIGETPGEHRLSDADVVELLSCYGIGVVDFVEVTDAAEAVAAAERLGYPVAAKATGATWRSRPDMSGVRLDLANAEAVRHGYSDLAQVTRSTRVHIQRMARRGIGCSIRVQDDPSFGSVVAFGMSGVLPQLLGDRAHAALPLTVDDATRLIEAPRSAPMLGGYGLSEPVDKAALVDILERISALCEDNPEVRELACEPVLASGRGADVLHATIRIGPVPTRPDIGPRRID